MTVFSGWLQGKALGLGGVEALIDKLPQCQSTLAAAWIAGISTPSYRGQIALSDALGVSVELIRKLLDQPYTEFSEWLVRKIIARGTIADFCRKTDIRYSALNKWIGHGVLPDHAYQGSNCGTAQRICDALIEWGDPTPPNRLLAEVGAVLARSASARTPVMYSSTKIATSCNFSKIAT